MKKMLKFIGIIILVPIILIIILLIISSFKLMTPSNYTKEVETGGNIEKKYLAMGEKTVKNVTRKGSDITKNFYIYYPEDLENNNKKYPIVIMLNGTGVLPKKYKALFEHLASWDFVVIGNDDDSTGFGKSADETIEFIKNENTNKDSIFYEKFDMDNIGITGHSQGGAGVFTAISIMDYKDSYKTAVALSPTNEEMAHQLGWNYDLTKINIPILMLAGTEGDFETKSVIPIEKMSIMYDKIQSTKVMARRIGEEHGQMLYSADGYVTAWFMYYLQNDELAKELFQEISNNNLYQDQKLNIIN